MKKVTVIMSAYNGSKYIETQLDSIFRQKDVDVTCYVRNDGSTDNTLEVLNNFAPHIKHGSLIISDGDNVGWEKSFLLGLKDAPEGDYYAFADQDDLWFDNKLINGIEMIESKGNSNIPMMYHCNKISTDENLRPLKHQVRRTPKPLNRKNAMIQEYAQGCSIILNSEARNLVLKHLPKEKIAHDFWCGLICYMFGDIIYDNRPHFYHISHGNNASGEGHTVGSWKGRLRKFFSDSSVYYLPLPDLIEGYNDMLTNDDKSFLKILLTYKHSFRAKSQLLFSTHFIRDSIMGTLSLKMAILLNKL